jgi:uncharacterized membrane protein YccC
MQYGKDYFRQIQKFTTSQYWNSGVRITAGVMIPMLVMIFTDTLTQGIPFLFGALFVSLTDTPGPIHHRRNGMAAATLINTMVVLCTSMVRFNEPLLIFQVLTFSFVLALSGIYGARAGAVGTLAIVMMLLNMSPFREIDPVKNAVLTGAGGVWYAIFSIALYRLQPYRIVEQALGEHLLLIGGYVRARASFYRTGADLENVFNRVMKEQIEVLRAQEQMRDLLFKTRQFLGDASPKSRSMMMIFLESLDIFEESMYSYQDYHTLQHTVPPELLNKFYRTILLLVAEFEHIGFLIQSGAPVRTMPLLAAAIDELEKEVATHKLRIYSPDEKLSVQALEKTIANIRSILQRLSHIIGYSRMEVRDTTRFPDQEAQQPDATPKFTLRSVLENLTFRSNNFRYAVRITIGLMAGYAISTFFSLSHAYWVMLTVVTILKPVYHLTRRRNYQRVAGTLGGVLLASAILYLVSNNTVLVAIMILCMLAAYSLLRINDFGFVTFLTIYILITIHFLNPFEFRSLIGERLIDTLIGSVIAAISARFIFPLWQHQNIHDQIKKMLVSGNVYFLSLWNKYNGPHGETRNYDKARNEAIVSLTNISESFQQMLAEPADAEQAAYIHQFVITSHTLTSRISSLAAKDFEAIPREVSRAWAEAISDTLQRAIATVNDKAVPEKIEQVALPRIDSLHPISIIHGLAAEALRIVARLNTRRQAG